MSMETIFAFYSRLGAALFPIPAGSKSPVGIVSSFKYDYSTDPAQWRKWYAEYKCNFGVVGFASWLIIVDIDTKIGREAAWAAWSDLCRSWGIEPVTPQVESARGGWHAYFRIPAHLNPLLMRQPDAIKKIINIRVIGFTVAAGSYYDGTAKGEASGHYSIINEVDAFPAPQPLLDLCTRKEIVRANGTAVKPSGYYNPEHVRKLLLYMMDPNRSLPMFDSYEEWIQAGMILRLEFGDDIGFDLWCLTTWKSETAESMAKHWESFATRPLGNQVTIRTLFMRAHREAGWKENVGPSWQAVQDEIARTGKPPEPFKPDPNFAKVKEQAAVAAVAAAPALLPAGPASTLATLAASVGAQLPMPSNTGPGAALGDAVGALTEATREAEQVRLWGPMLEAFTANPELPTRPLQSTYPQIPTVATHALVAPLRPCLDRVVAYGESVRQKFKTARVVDPLAVLQLVHNDTYKSAVMFLRGMECPVNERMINIRAMALQTEVEKIVKPVNDWRVDIKGKKIANNADNVEIFLESIGVALRWNDWLDIVEIRGWKWESWTLLDDRIFDQLYVHAHRDQIEFDVGREFLWASLRSVAADNAADPAREELDRLQAAWDGKSRLATWMTYALGVECDPYHQAVGRALIGSMVRRIREPGCKQDYVVVFWGPEGTGKSTLAQRIAPRPEWFTDSVKLGDEAKELVGLLAGKAVVEFAEMAVRGQREAEHVKAMITSQVDEGRRAYDRVVTKRPRRNIFIGTSNPAPLTDTGANRRFFPVLIKQAINTAWFEAHREQLIGEAAHRHSAGESFDIPISIRTLAAERREDARTAPPVEIAASAWLSETSITAAAPWTYITAHDMQRACEAERIKYSTTALSDTMRRLNFRRDKLTVDGKEQRVWVRGKEARRKQGIVEAGFRYIMGEKGLRLTAPQPT